MSFNHRQARGLTKYHRNVNKASASFVLFCFFLPKTGRVSTRAWPAGFELKEAVTIVNTRTNVAEFSLKQLTGSLSQAV